MKSHDIQTAKRNSKVNLEKLEERNLIRLLTDLIKGKICIKIETTEFKCDILKKMGLHTHR